MKINTIFLFLILCKHGFAQQTAFYPGGASIFSLGGISASQEGVTSMYHNPAALNSFDKSIGFDVSIDSRFISNFYNPSFGIVKRVDKSRIALGYYQNGISEYKTSNLFLSYARPLIKNLSIGARVNYHQIFIQDYGKSNLIAVDFGFFSKVSKAISISAFYDAIVSSKFNTDLKKDNRIVLGFIYHPSNKVKLISEFEKAENNNLSPKLGISYSPNSKIQFNCGIDLEREMVGFGFRYNLNKLNIGAAQSIHTQLGNIFSLSINGEK